MSKLRILSNNAADRATVTVASTAAGMGADKLLTDTKGEICRVLAGTAQIVATWTVAETVAAVVIPACNLGPSSTIRMRAYSDVAGTLLLADSGVRYAAAGSILGYWDFTQPLNVNAFADGAPLVACYLPTHEAAKRVVIDLYDPDLAFIDMSRLVIGGYFEPEYNADFGAMVGTQDNSKNTRAASGDLKTEWGPKNRLLTFDLNWVVDSERGRTRQIISGGIGKWLFISLFPEDPDPVKEQDYSIYGKPTQAGKLTYTSLSVHSTRFEIDGY